MRRALVLGALLGLVGCSGEKAPDGGAAGAAAPDLSTPEAALDAWVRAWSTKDLALYEALLHPGYLHVAEEVDDDPTWSREQELQVAQGAFHPDAPVHEMKVGAVERRDSEIVPGGVELRADVSFEAKGGHGHAHSATRVLSFHFERNDAGSWQLRVLEEHGEPPAAPADEGGRGAGP
jgi:hypothetical protein